MSDDCRSIELEVEVPGRVAVWEPPRRVVFDGGEGDGEHVTVSIWSYLYEADGAAAAERDEPRWRRWLTERAPTAGCRATGALWWLGSGSSRHPPDYIRTPPVHYRRAVVDGGEDWLHRTADSGSAVARGG